MTTKVQADLIARLRRLLEGARVIVKDRIAQLDDEGDTTDDEARLLADIDDALR